MYSQLMFCVMEIVTLAMVVVERDVVGCVSA